MPQVYRITRARHADLSGEGARLAGGRWNRSGNAAVYASENRALAVLETLVHISLRRIPRDLVLLTIALPEDTSQTRYNESDLPPGWREAGAESLRELGDEWLAAAASSVLWVPSAILPDEYNAILNPLHPAHSLAEIVREQSFVFDERLLASGLPRQSAG